MEIKTEITIAASANQVWQVLTNFEAYPEWNPFLTKVIGRAQVGTTLTNTIELSGKKPQVFKPKVLTVTPDREFRWLGRLFIRGLFDGEHYFLIESIDESNCRLIHGERFSGVLKGMVMGMIRQQTLEGFEAMNQALKGRVERINEVR